MERSRPEGISGRTNCHRWVWYDDVRPPRPRKRVRGHDFIRFGRSKAETGRRPVADERQGPAAPAETKQTRRGRVTRSPRFPAPTPPRQRVRSAEPQEEVIPCAQGPRKPWIRTTARLPTRATCKCRCVRRLRCAAWAASSPPNHTGAALRYGECAPRLPNGGSGRRALPTCVRRVLAGYRPGRRRRRLLRSDNRRLPSAGSPCGSCWRARGRLGSSPNPPRCAKRDGCKRKPTTIAWQIWLRCPW